MFKGIPYQIKLTTTSDESRKQLPDYFVEYVKSSKRWNNVVFLRKWQDLGVRYGNLEEVMNEVYEESLLYIHLKS